MKISKEYRRWLTKLTMKFGKPKGWLLDCPRMEIKNDKSKKNYKRCRTVADCRYENVP